MPSTQALLSSRLCRLTYMSAETKGLTQCPQPKLCFLHAFADCSFRLDGGFAFAPLVSVCRTLAGDAAFTGVDLFDELTRARDDRFDLAIFRSISAMACSREAFRTDTFAGNDAMTCSSSSRSRAVSSSEIVFVGPAFKSLSNRT